MLELGRDPLSGRSLFALELASPAVQGDQIALPGHGHFVALLALDANALSATAVSQFLGPILAAGAVYVCAWGPGCERVHDITDEIVVGDNPCEDGSNVILTTWHDHESLEETVLFVLDSAWPAEEYEGTCSAIVAITCGRADWAKEINAIFSARVAGQHDVGSAWHRPI